jgi:cation diffusion facilitator CzcD-associated flavoprotein CzcO
VIEQSGHGTVTIGAVEKYITETAWSSGWVKPPKPVAAERPQSVGIVGAGPAGLAAADKLRRKGYQVHVYDRYDRPGGLLIYGIPNFKLEKAVVERRSKLLADAGVQFHLNFEVGRDATLDDLRKRHDAVLIATGVYRARDIQAPGSGQDNIVPAMTYLTASNKHGLGDTVPEFASGQLDAKGKKVVVIGANNSAHDICAALWEAGVDVTMVQRSSTHIVKSDSLMDLALGALYSERAVAAGMTTARADLTFASIPYAILHQFQIPVFNAIRERDAEFYARLEKSGFMLDFGDDDSGLFMKYLRRGSGYYIDVGASELVADGKIKLKSGVDVERIKPQSVVFSDGSELPADLIVYATGYSSMNGWAAQLISKETADKVGKCWGLGSNTTKDPGPWEGELRSMWKPTQQPGLWFHGGNLHQSRHYSQFLSLQLKARMENIPTPVYGMTPVCHLS